MDDLKKEQIEKSSKVLTKIIYDNREKILADKSKSEVNEGDILDKTIGVINNNRIFSDPINTRNIISSWADNKNDIIAFIADNKRARKVAAQVNNRKLARTIMYKETVSNIVERRLARVFKYAKSNNIDLSKTDVDGLTRIFKGKEQMKMFGKTNKYKYNKAMRRFTKSASKNANMEKLIEPYGTRKLLADKLSNTRVGKWIGNKVNNSKSISKMEDWIMAATNSKFGKATASKANDLSRVIANSKLFQFGKNTISKADDITKAATGSKAFKFGKKVVGSKYTQGAFKGLGKAFTGMGYAMNGYTVARDPSKFKKVLAGLDLVGDGVGTALAATGVLAPLGGAISFTTSALNFVGSYAYDNILSDSIKEKLDNASGKYIVDPIVGTSKKLWGAVKAKVKAIKKNPIKELAKTSMAITNPLAYGALKLGKRAVKPFQPKIANALKGAKDKMFSSIKAKIDAIKKNPIKEAAKTFNPIGYGAFKLGQKAVKAYGPKISNALKPIKDNISNSMKTKFAAIKKNPAKEIAKLGASVALPGIFGAYKAANMLKGKLFKVSPSNLFDSKDGLNKSIKGRTRGIKSDSNVIDLYNNNSKNIRNNNARSQFNGGLLEAKLIGNKKHNSNKNNFTININGSSLSVDEMANELASKIQLTMENVYA